MTARIITGKQRGGRDRPVTVFLSCARADIKLRDELVVHLQPLLAQELIEISHDGLLLPGDDLVHHLAGAERADVLMLLVSAHVWTDEHVRIVLEKAAPRAHARGRLLAVSIRPCDWSAWPFAGAPVVPVDGRAVSEWPSRDAAFRQVASALSWMVEKGLRPTRSRVEGLQSTPVVPRVAEKPSPGVLACVIYVPRCNITDDDWLTAAFFLWDRVYRIAPRGLHHRPGRLEERLFAAAPEFSPTLNLSAAMESAVERYERLIDRCHDIDWARKAGIPELLNIYPQEVVVHDEKVHPDVLAVWQEYDVWAGRAGPGHRVPRFWVDLWITTLAREIGRQDRVLPVTDDPLTIELIRLIALVEEEEATDAFGVRAAMQPHFARLLLKLLVPAPGIAGSATRHDLTSWIEAKETLSSLRSAYHQHVAEIVRELPVHIEPTTGMESLARRARAVYEAGVPAWRRGLRKLGLRLLETSLLLHVPTSSAGPVAAALFEHRVRRTLGST